MEPLDGERSSHPFHNILKATVGLAPLGIAAGVIYQHVSSNASMNPMAALNPNTRKLTSVVRKAGSVAGQALKTDKARQVQSAKALAGKIMQADQMQKLLGTVSETRALAQSLVDFIDDPGNGIEQGKLMDHKQKILGLMNETIGTDQAEEAISAVVKAIQDDAGGSASARWEDNLRQYRRIGSQLTAPKPLGKFSEAFEPISPGQLTEAARGRYGAMKEILGSGGQRFDVIQMRHGDVTQQYARIFAPGEMGSMGKHLTTIPLDLGRDTGSPLSPMFMGENLQTGYAMPRSVIDGELANKVLRGGGNNHQHVVQGAGMDLPDYILQRLKGSMYKGQKGQRFDARKFNAGVRQFGEIMPRFFSEEFDAAPGLTSHLKSTANFSRNMALVVNMGSMNREGQYGLMTTLGTTRGFDASSPGRTLLGREEFTGHTYGTINFANQSAIQQLRTIGVADRQAFPVLSRVEQLVGRQSMFVGAGKAGGRGGHLNLGATFSAQGQDVVRHAQNIDLTDAVTGGMNRVTFMDVGSGSSFYKNVQGSGAGFHSSKFTTLTPFTKPVLDPATHGVQSSRLLDHLRANAKEGELLSFTRQQLQDFGFFAGTGPNGLQYLRNDPRMTSMRMGYRVHQANGKTQIHLTGFVEREMDNLKVFSPMFKGMMQYVEPEVLQRHLNDWGLNLGELGIGVQDATVTTGDMLKKAPGYLDQQMRSAYAMVSGDKNFDDSLKIAAGMAPLNAGLGLTPIGRTTSGVIRSLATSRATPKEAGHALAGAYFMGGKHGVAQADVEAAVRAAYGGGDSSALLSQLKAAHAEFAPLYARKMDANAPVLSHIEQDRMGALQSQMNGLNEQLGAFARGNRVADEVIAGMKSGRTFALTSMVHGTGPGDYGVGQAGLERRHFQMIAERLRMAGKSPGEISDFLAGLARRKRGMGHHIKTAKGMMEMMESVAGIKSPVAAVQDMMDHLPTYNLGDVEMLSRKLKDGSLDQLMEMHPKGFTLDLTAGAENKAQREIAAAAQAKLGQGQVFIPGKDVMDSIRQTSIKTAAGWEAIDDRFTGMVGGFMSDLFNLGTKTGDVATDAADLMDNFKTSVAELTSASVTNLAKGKMRGNVSAHAALLVQDPNDPLKSAILNRLIRKTRGRAVFADTNLFMSNLQDFMGGQGLSTAKAATLAETYFLGLEDVVARSRMSTTTSRRGKVSTRARVRGVFDSRSIPQMIGRNPALSVGNVPIVETYRALHEVGQADDKWLGAFLDSTHGKGWKGKVSTWQDVSRLSRAKGNNQRRAFFIDFAKSARNYDVDGGGMIYLPRIERDVHGIFSSGTKMTVDFGASAAAIGDYDGDTWFSMLMDHKTGGVMMEGLRGKEGAAYSAADSRYKMITQAFTDEAKFGLDAKKADRHMSLTDVQRVQQDLLKEDFAQSTVGQLDVRTNMIRTAISQTKNTDEAQAALAFLKVMQEHLVIKSKKLDEFVPYAQKMNTAIDELIAGRPEALNTFMKEEIFAGTKLAGEGIEIKGIDHGNLQYLKGQAPTGRITLDSVMTTIKDAVAANSDRGTEYLASEKRLLKELVGSSDKVEAVMAALRAGESIESALLAGAIGRTAATALQEGGHAVATVAARAHRLDRKTMGIAALGFLGSMLTTGLVTGGGFEPKPLQMEGEYIPPELRNQIAAASLAGHRDPQVSPDQYNHPGSPYEHMTRPINMQQTYLNKPSSYQLRGRMTSLGNANMLNDYMSSVSGGTVRGGIRIEDARRPITSSYLDRLTGTY